MMEIPIPLAVLVVLLAWLIGACTGYRWGKEKGREEMRNSRTYP